LAAAESVAAGGVAVGGVTAAGVSVGALGSALVPAAAAEVAGSMAAVEPSIRRICGPPSCVGGASAPGFKAGSPGWPDGGAAGFGGADERTATAGVGESPHPQQATAPNAITRIAMCRSMIVDSV
jgi:hypothetical protein